MAVEPNSAKLSNLFLTHLLSKLNKPELKSLLENRVKQVNPEFYLTCIHPDELDRFMNRLAAEEAQQVVQSIQKALDAYLASFPSAYKGKSSDSGM